MAMLALNTKPVGFIGVLVLVASLLQSSQISNGLVDAITHPTAQSIVSLLSLIGGVVLTYYGMPHSVKTNAEVPAGASDPTHAAPPAQNGTSQ